MSGMVLPETLSQVGTAKDDRTPIFGIKFHKDVLTHIEHIKRGINSRLVSRNEYAHRKEGDLYFWKLEAGYYILYLSFSIDPVVVRITRKGYLIVMSLAEACEDLSIKSNTLSPWIL